MTLFEDVFRPWPHVYKPGLKSQKFYERIDANIKDDLAALRTYEEREDSETYIEILSEVFRLFGEGIIASLEYTMSDYLGQTNGALSNNQKEEWEIEAAKGMLCHNNHAERPFAVLRAFAKTYPALSLRNLAWLSHSLVNGTHRPARTFGVASARERNGSLSSKAGFALTAHPSLRRAVNVVCSVRRKTVGAVTTIVRQTQNDDKTEQIETRKRKAHEHYEARIRSKTTKAARVDKAEHIAAHHLVLSIHDLQNELEARQSNKQSRINFLKEQFAARVNCEVPRSYTTIGNEYRKRGGGLRKCPEDKTKELTYLTELIKLMIVEDQDTLGFNDFPLPNSSFEYIRFLPTISTAFANPQGNYQHASFNIADSLSFKTIVV
jgi:hypothetical protein